MTVPNTQTDDEDAVEAAMLVLFEHRVTLSAFRRRYISFVFELCKTKAGAARVLGIDRRNVIRALKQIGGDS